MKRTVTNEVLVKQLIRSATSSAANYRAACRAKSNTDFVYKLKIVEEELDESVFWLEILEEFNQSEKLKELMTEADELIRIIVASILTLKKKSRSDIRKS